MTNALVLVEACSICYRVQKTYLGHRSRRQTPLVCADCSREAQKSRSQPSPKTAQASQRGRG